MHCSHTVEISFSFSYRQNTLPNRTPQLQTSINHLSSLEKSRNDKFSSKKVQTTTCVTDTSTMLVWRLLAARAHNESMIIDLATLLLQSRGIVTV